MLRTPTEVLIRIGQIAVMKMTKIAEGWPSRNAASDERQPGQRRHGAQDLEDRIERRAWRSRAGRAARRARCRPRPRGEAERHPLQAGGEMPEQALVEPAAVVERVDDQLPAVVRTVDGGGSGDVGPSERAARRRAGSRSSRRAEQRPSEREPPRPERRRASVGDALADAHAGLARDRRRWAGARSVGVIVRHRWASGDALDRRLAR